MTDHLTPKNFDEQIEILKNRGLQFENEERAKKYLSYIGYQRLSVYWNYFYIDKIEKNAFKREISFENILDLYIFDRKLRVLFFEATERIEVCIKVLFSDILCRNNSSAFWYNDASLFRQRLDKYEINGELKQEIFNHKMIMKKIEESIQKIKKNNKSLKGFTNLKDTPIPSWKLCDMITFGAFSNIMSLINGSNDTELYEKFNLPKIVLDNWLECIVNIRNICAHYGLLYRRSFAITPRSLTKSKKRSYTIDFETSRMKFYAQFYIFSYLLEKISPTSTWVSRVNSLIETHISNPLLSLDQMGFPDNWKEDPLLSKMLQNNIK